MGLWPFGVDMWVQYVKCHMGLWPFGVSMNKLVKNHFISKVK